MVHQAYNAPARIWSPIKVSLSNVRWSEISGKISNTSSSVQSTSPCKILNLWYLVDLDLFSNTFRVESIHQWKQHVHIHPYLLFPLFLFLWLSKYALTHLNPQTLMRQTAELLRTQMLFHFGQYYIHQDHSHLHDKWTQQEV